MFHFVRVHAFDRQTDGQTAVASKTVHMLRSCMLKDVLLYGVDIFTYDYFVLSGCKRWTNRRTNGRTDRQMWIARCDLTKLDAHKNHTYNIEQMCVLEQTVSLPHNRLKDTNWSL